MQLQNLARKCARRICLLWFFRSPILAQEDLASLALIRAYELAGNPNSGNPRWVSSVMLNSMRDAIKKESRRRWYIAEFEEHSADRRKYRNPACLKCGIDQKNLITHHHILPRRHGGTATVPLCKGCHSEIENFYLLHERPQYYQSSDELFDHYLDLFKKWLKGRNEKK
jgi:hypothetical protein